jgi:hypothetical protein
MSRIRTSSKPFKISESLGRQLNTYAQVACAAGVSVLALAGASDAEVVYTETHQVTDAGGAALYIDLNHDGVNDFLLRTNFYIGTSGTDLALSVRGDDNAHNLVAGRRFSSGDGYFFSAAYALRAGARIGPKTEFSATFPFLAEEHFDKVGDQYSDLGPWDGNGKGVENRYLGLKFMIDGEVHYGWARLSVKLGHERQFDDVSGTLTGYAYETVPNKPIIAGKITGADVVTTQDATLGGLALGRR